MLEENRAGAVELDQARHEEEERRQRDQSKGGCDQIHESLGQERSGPERGSGELQSGDRAQPQQLGIAEFLQHAIRPEMQFCGNCAEYLGAALDGIRRGPRREQEDCIRTGFTGLHQCTFQLTVEHVEAAGAEATRQERKEAATGDFDAIQGRLIAPKECGDPRLCTNDKDPLC